MQPFVNKYPNGVMQCFYDSSSIILYPDNIMNVKVIKSLSRNYGYTLQWINNNNRPSWVIGIQNTFTWYKYKRDAIKTAEYYNLYQE